MVAFPMPVVRFPWGAHLMSIGREAVPKAARAWSMTAAEADVFPQAVQARMAFAQMHCHRDGGSNGLGAGLFRMRPTGRRQLARMTG
jgi:hypothetical protein